MDRRGLSMKKFFILVILFLLDFTFYCKKFGKNKTVSNQENSFGNYKILSIENNLKDVDKSYYPDIDNPELIEEGSSETNLRNNSEKFYLEYWKMIAKNFKENERAKEVIQNILNDFTSKIKVKTVSENLAIVTRPETGLAELNDVSDVEDIWFQKSGKWQPFLNFNNKFYKVKVLDLNGDKLLDVIIYGGCCDSSTYNIILANAEGELKHIQDIVLIGESDEDFARDCKAKISVTHYQDSTLGKKAKFDCSINKFVLY
jgi:hypothetical protein